MKIIAGIMGGGVWAIPFFGIAVLGAQLRLYGFIDEPLETIIAGIALIGVIGCLIAGIIRSLSYKATVFVTKSKNERGGKA